MPSPPLPTPNLPRPLCLARKAHGPSLLPCSQGAHSPRPWGPGRLLLSCCLGPRCNVWWGRSHFATPGATPTAETVGWTSHEHRHLEHVALTGTGKSPEAGRPSGRPSAPGPLATTSGWRPGDSGNMPWTWVTCLDVSGEGHVDLLPVRGDPVQQQGVVHGAVPRSLELVKGPGRGRDGVRTTCSHARLGWGHADGWTDRRHVDHPQECPGATGPEAWGAVSRKDRPFSLRPGAGRVASEAARRVNQQPAPLWRDGLDT